MADDVTMRDLLNATESLRGDFNARMSRLDARIDTLVATTNHRLDEARGQRERDLAHLAQQREHDRAERDDLVEGLRTELEKKTDDTELLGSLLFKLLKHPAARWAMGASATAVAGTAAAAHWSGAIARLFGF